MPGGSWGYADHLAGAETTQEAVRALRVTQTETREGSEARAIYVKRVKGHGRGVSCSRLLGQRNCNWAVTLRAGLDID